MDRAIEMTAIVQREVEDYAGPTLLGKSYAISDQARQIYTVLVVPDYPPKFDSGIVVLAHVVDDKVIIDEDLTDRPLWKELVRAGIPPHANHPRLCWRTGARTSTRIKKWGDSRRAAPLIRRTLLAHHLIRHALDHDDDALADGEVVAQLRHLLQQREILVAQEGDLLRRHRVRLECGIRPHLALEQERLIVHRLDGVARVISITTIRHRFPCGGHRRRGHRRAGPGQSGELVGG